MKKTRVVVDARIPVQGWGGVQQVAIGLAQGLTTIAAPDLDLIYLCYPDGPTWLRDYVASPEQFKFVAAPQPQPAAKSWVSRNLRFVRNAYHAVMPPPPVPRSDGTLEAMGADVVHFPHQAAFLTSVKSIYQPHDLQHMHLPQFFSRLEIKSRETQYRAFCNQASLVAMATTWGRDDILRAFGLPPEKVKVVALAPIIDRYPVLAPAELEKLRIGLRLPEAFCFYPAQTWPHKNHEMLIRAVAKLRRDGLVVPLVFSGASTPYREHLERVSEALGIASDIRWVGFVQPAQLRGLYRLARCVAVPTLFESASQPIFEALSSGVALACSNVTAGPRQVGDAALIFDPRSVDEIAAAVKRLWTEPELRRDLIERGKRRIAQFSWERTAHQFAAYYRLFAGRELSSEDQSIISAEPII